MSDKFQVTSCGFGKEVGVDESSLLQDKFENT